MIRFFAPITKVNVATREVEGTFALEKKDKSGEIMDYASSKKYFEEWSDAILKSSGGKSYGNVREMHGNISAGKLTRIEYDDDLKLVKGIAKVVSNESWEKVQEGMLNGFSIGGDYVGPKVYDKVAKAKRYTVKPSEISLVDNPCMYGAEFSLVNDNGEIEVRKFAGNKEVEQFWSCPSNPVHHHAAKAEAQHCTGEDTQVEKLLDSDLDFLNERRSERAEDEITNKLAELTDMVETLAGSLTKSVEGDKKMTKETVVEEEDSEVLDTESVQKMVGVSMLKFVKSKDFKTALKSAVDKVVEESLSEMNESIETISDTVLKMAKSAGPTRVVLSKSADGKRLSEDDDDEAPKKKKVVLTRTDDKNELVKSMKNDLKRPIVINLNDDDDDDDTEDDE